MNKLSALIAAILFSIQFANAQTEKGNQTLGVNVGYQHASNTTLYIDPTSSNTTNREAKTTSFFIAPTYSYFVANNLDLGASLSYTRYHVQNIDPLSDPQDQKANSYGGTVFLRKYIMYQNRFGIRTGPYISYSRGTSTYTYTPANSIYDTKSTINNFGAGLNLDLVFYPTNKLGVTASIANVSYNHNKQDNGKQGNNSGDGVNASFISNNLGLSVFYVFGK